MYYISSPEAHTFAHAGIKEISWPFSLEPENILAPKINFEV